MLRFLRTLQFRFRLPLCLVLAGLLAACQDGTSNDDSSSLSSITGNAVKGLLINGTIRAYQLNPNTNERIPLGSTTTDEYGEFSLTLNSTPRLEQHPVLVEFEATEDSAMICDLVQGCLNQFDGIFYDFGDAMPLDPNFMMLGLVEDQHAYLSPLSHLLVSTAQRLPGGLNANNIHVTSQQIVDIFALSASVSKTKTVDLSSINALNMADKNELTQAIWSAAFFELSQTSDWIDQTYHLNNLPLAQIFSNAVALLNDLEEDLTGLPRTHVSANLDSLRHDTIDQYNNITSDSLHFIYQPIATHIEEGEALTLNVLAISPDQEITYQWLRDDQPIEGANQSILHIENSQLHDQGIYRVIASTASTSIVSLSVHIDINDIPQSLSIIEEPAAQHIQIDQPFSLSVAAIGEGELSYQWQRNGSVLPSATSAHYTVEKATVTDEGNYRVIITNGTEEVSSKFVSVVINEELTPVIITSPPQDLSLVEGMNAAFTVEATGGGYLNYQWLKDDLPITGATSRQLSINQVSTADIGLYSVIVGNSLGNQYSQAARLSVISNGLPLIISRQPLSQTVELNEGVLFSVEASGDGLLSYQWLFNGEPIVGATNSSYEILEPTLEHSGDYSVIIKDGLSTLQSNSAALSVTPRRELQLSWSIPTQREDGDPLPVHEIGGYVVEYGTNYQALDQRIEINSATQTHCTLSDLSSGTLYVRIATVDHLGIQGTFSGIVAITIP